MGIASIRRLSRPSDRSETQDASRSTDNPLGLDTSLRSYSTGALAQRLTAEGLMPTCTSL